jgi:hypothetical protein
MASKRTSTRRSEAALATALARANEKLARTQAELRASADEVSLLREKLAARTEMSDGLFQLCDRAIRRCAETQDAMHKWRAESQADRPLAQTAAALELSKLVHSTRANFQSLQGYMESALEESREISEVSRTLIAQLHRTDLAPPGSGGQRIMQRFTLVDALVLLDQRLQSALNKEAVSAPTALGRPDEGVSAKLEALTQRIVKLCVFLEHESRKPDDPRTATVALGAISDRIEQMETLLVSRLEALATPVSNHLALVRKLATKMGAG